MKWTLALIVVISLAVGVTHAAVSSTTNNNRRTTSCQAGYTWVRDRCIRLNSSQAAHSTAPVTHTTPTPRIPSSRAPQQQQSSAQPQNVASPAPTCPLGQVMKNGKCTAKQCPSGMAVNAEGKCDCTPGHVKQNNKCVNTTLQQACTSRGGQLSRKGNCVQPTPAPPAKTCPPGHELNDANKCTLVATAPRTCPSGQRLNRKGACIPIVVGQSCGADLWIDEQGKCGAHRPNGGCPVGKERNGMGNCVKIQVCITGQVKDKTGVCQPQSCPSNKVMKNGECVDIAINDVARG